MNSKELRAKRAGIVEGAQALLTGGDMSAEVQARFDAMMDEADALKANIDRVERADAEVKALAEDRHRRGEGNGVSADEQGDRDAQAKRAFAKYLIGGVQAMDDAERRVAMAHMSPLPGVQAAIGTAPGSAGGFTVPQGFMAELQVRMLAYGGMRAVARVVPTESGAPMPVPTMDDTANVASIVAEGTQITADADPTYGQVTLNAFMYTSNNVRVSFQLLQDSAFNVEQTIRDALAIRFARGTNAHFTTGTGTGQPQGVVTGATVGRVGATGTATTINYSELLQLEHSVDPAYRTGARWMFHDNTLRVLKGLLDADNRPLWSAGIGVGAPDTILNYPYTINQDMPVMAANARSVLFGDFSAYVIREVQGVQVLRLTERFADFLQVGFLGFGRWDGRLVTAAQPIRAFQNSAT